MKKNQAIWMVLGIIIILAYGFLDPDQYRFPPCPFRTLTGLLCPGCGSQRAIHQVLHGNFLQAFRLNPLFLPAVLYGLTGLIISNFFPKVWPAIRSDFFGLNAAYISLAVILVFGIVRNLV